MRKEKNSFLSPASPTSFYFIPFKNSLYRYLPHYSLSLYIKQCSFKLMSVDGCVFEYEHICLILLDSFILSSILECDLSLLLLLLLFYHFFIRRSPFTYHHDYSFIFWLMLSAAPFPLHFTPLPFTINCLWLFLFVISFSSVCCFGSQHLCRAFLSSSSASGSNGCTVFRLVERPLSCRVHHRHHHYKLFPTILSFSFRKFSR